MSANVFSNDFAKTVGGYLQDNCSERAVTRPELAQVIRRVYGRKMDPETLTVWLSASVNLGLFNTDNAKFITKRGVKGGIVMTAPRKRAAKKA